MDSAYGKRLSVIGLGVVGLTTAVGFRLRGFEVTGIDIDEHKVAQINDGVSPIYERKLAKRLQEAKFTATTDLEQIVDTHVTFICGGTPGNSDGSINLAYVQKPLEQLSELLRKKGQPHLVVIRSTVVPGTTDRVVAPYFRDSPEVGICVNPEFLRMGTALEDFCSPDRIVIGEDGKEWGDLLINLYDGLEAPVIRTDFTTAEMIKYASNAFLAAKISFINEMGNLCKRQGIDVFSVAEGMGLDHRIGPGHLRAGIGYGGSCFPKDTAALIAEARALGYDPQMLNQVVEVNNRQPKYMINLLKKHLPTLEGKVIGVLGLTFKPDTDDIRESPAIRIIEMLLEEGAKPRAYDPQGMRRFRGLFPSIEYAGRADEVLRSDAVLIVTEWPEFSSLDYSDCIVIDGRRVESARRHARVYEGICW